MRTSKAVGLGAGLVAVAMAAAACGGGDSGGDSGGGGSVEIVGAIGATNGDALQAEAAAISEATGIDVTYTTIPDFDTVIQSRVRGNNAPDIALFPQPGVLLDLKDDVVPLDDLIDLDAATTALIPGLESLAVADGLTYGLPASMNVKSSVWYPVTEFEDAGYTFPATHQELLALTDEIKADGGPAPWCFAFEAAAATGWYITDWIEEYVLRIGGPDVYDQWVTHEIPFDDPVVVQAGEAFEELVLAPGNATLSRPAMAATKWEDALQGVITDPPGCYMARQGNFVIGFWPPDVAADTAAYASSFLLPPYEGGWDGGQPVLGGGDVAAAFVDNEDVATVLEYIFSPQFGETWAGGEGSEFVSPYTTFDSTKYLSPTYAEIGGQVQAADVFRFDGSDLMPGQVGSGTFWTEMTAWVTEQKSLEDALAAIDASWPSS